MSRTSQEKTKKSKTAQIENIYNTISNTTIPTRLLSTEALKDIALNDYIEDIEVMAGAIKLLSDEWNSLTANYRKHRKLDLPLVKEIYRAIRNQDYSFDEFKNGIRNYAKWSLLVEKYQGKNGFWFYRWDMGRFLNRGMTHVDGTWNQVCDNLHLFEEKDRHKNEVGMTMDDSGMPILRNISNRG